MATRLETQVNGKSDVQVEDTRVLIKDLLIDDRDLAEYLSSVPDAAAAAIEALKLGARILRLAGTSGDVEMVKREFDAMITGISTNVEKVLAEARDAVGRRLTQFGTDELQTSLRNHRKELNEELVKLFGPESANSVQKQIDKMLDEQGKTYVDALAQLLEQTDDPDNPFYKLREELKGKAEEAVKEVRELRDKVIEIVGEARGAAAEAEKGTAKGRTYQQYVFEEIERIARIFGDTALFVANQPGEKGKDTGDVVAELNPVETSGTQIRIVVEAKNQKNVSAPAILRELDEAKENRVALAALAVFSRPDDVPNGLRTWRDYAGHRYICVLREDEPDPFALEFSYRCARVDALRSIEAEEAKLDVSAVKDLLKRIRGKLTDFQQMQSNLTGAKGSLEKVSELIEAHRKAMREDLDEIDRLFLVGQQASVESA